MKASFLRSLGLAILATLAIAACGPQQSRFADAPDFRVPTPTSQPGRAFPLGTGDQIEIVVFNHVDLSGPHIVPTDGMVAMPLIGAVQASGRTIEQVEQDVTARLREGFLKDPDVTVRVIKYRTVSVVGGVNNPGAFDYTPGMRVREAIAAAGDYSPEAVLTQSPLVVRADSPTQTPEVATVNDFIFPGDVIEIPSRRRRQ